MLFHLIKAICPDHIKTINISFLVKVVLVSLLFISSEVLPASNDSDTSDKYDKDKAFAFSQAALNRTIGSYKFVNKDKKPVYIMQYRGNHSKLRCNIKCNAGVTIRG